MEVRLVRPGNFEDFVCSQLGVRIGGCVVFVRVDGVADGLEFFRLVGYSMTVHFLFLQCGHHLRFSEWCFGAILFVFPPSQEEQCEDEEADGDGGG